MPSPKPAQQQETKQKQQITRPALTSEQAPAQADLAPQLPDLITAVGEDAIDNQASLLGRSGVRGAQRTQIAREINRHHGNRHLQQVVDRSQQLSGAVQLQAAGRNRARYEREDQEWAKKGIHGYRHGPLAPVGVGYHFWNFEPGKATIKGQPDPALMRQLIREVMKLYQPIIGFRYPQKGEQAWPVRENPYAQPALGVVRIDGVTDNVGGYAKEKTDRGLRRKRAEAIKKLILAHIPPPYQPPKIEVAPALSGMFKSDKGGKDAFSRAQNRAAVIHIRPAVQHLTDEQEKEVFERDVKKRYHQAWLPRFREFTRQRLRMSKLPGDFSDHQKRIKDIGEFVIDNFEILMFRRGQELRFGVRVPQPGKRPEAQADVPDAKKVDDLEMLKSCAIDYLSEWQQYGLQFAQGPSLIGKPWTPSERRTAIKLSRLRRERLIRFWRFFKKTKGAYAMRERAKIRKEFQEQIKVARKAGARTAEEIGPPARLP